MNKTILLIVFLLAACNPYVDIYPTAEPTATAITATPRSVQADPTATPTPLTCKISTGVPAGSLNLRTGPGTKYAVARVLSEGKL